jgi:hypothetical protein
MVKSRQAPATAASARSHSPRLLLNGRGLLLELLQIPLGQEPIHDAAGAANPEMKLGREAKGSDGNCDRSCRVGLVEVSAAAVPTGL